MTKIRVQKFFSDNGIMSRRHAEKEIEAGLVKINGVVAHLGDQIDPSCDTVEYKNKPLTPQKQARPLYVMLNKPRGYLSSVSDDRGRRCVTELIRDIDARLYPVGRLDMDSEGLLLLTNDGALTYKLTHPKHDIPKIYHVRVAGTPTREQLKQLSSPMVIDDYTIQPVKCDLISIKEDYSVLRMELYEGRNRQIRKMCEQVELPLLRLIRVAIGNIRLGDLAPGKWRYLTPSQVNYLKQNGGVTHAKGTPHSK